MSRDRTLSEELLAYIDAWELHQDHEAAAQVREEEQRAKGVVEVVVSDVVRSRETLTDDQIPGIEKLVRGDPDLIAFFLDDRFTREVVEAVPGYVRRTLHLSRMGASRTPSAVTNNYLREATRAYVLGLPQACVALCRAALEQGLKENLGYQQAGEFITFQKLVDEAVRYHLLDRTTAKMARSMALAGDRVLHEQPTDLAAARDVLCQVRGLLQQVYLARGH